MTSEPDAQVPPAGAGEKEAAHRAELAWRSTIGVPNAVVHEFDFWNDRFEGRRRMSYVLDRKSVV